MDRDDKIRKYRKNINIYGKAMLAFSVWSVIKYIITSLLGNADRKADLDTTDWTINGVVMTIYFLIGVYISLSAMRYAKNGRSYRLLVTATIMYILTVFVSIVISIIILIIIVDEPYNIDTIIVSLTTDITMCYVMIDLVINVFRLKRLTKSEV